jgi:hypothetical protein
VTGADWHRRGGEQTKVEEEAFLLRLFTRRVTVGWTGLWWRWARVGLRLVGCCGATAGLLRPGEVQVSLLFFLFLFSVFFISFQFESDLNSYFICRFLIVLNLIRL